MASSGNQLQVKRPPGRGGARGGPQAQRSLSAWLRDAQGKGTDNNASNDASNNSNNNANNNNNNNNSQPSQAQPQPSPQQQYQPQPQPQPWSQPQAYPSPQNMAARGYPMQPSPQQMAQQYGQYPNASPMQMGMNMNPNGGMYGQPPPQMQQQMPPNMMQQGGMQPPGPPNGVSVGVPGPPPPNNNGMTLASAQKIDNNNIGNSQFTLFSEAESIYGNFKGGKIGKIDPNMSNNNNNNNKDKPARIKVSNIKGEDFEPSPTDATNATVIVNNNSNSNAQQQSDKMQFGYGARHLNNPSMMSGTTYVTDTSYDSDETKQSALQSTAGAGPGGAGGASPMTYSYYNSEAVNEPEPGSPEMTQIEEAEQERLSQKQSFANSANNLNNNVHASQQHLQNNNNNNYQSQQQLQSPPQTAVSQSVTVTYQNNYNNNYPPSQVNVKSPVNNANNGSNNNPHNNGQNSGNKGRKMTLEEYDPWAAENKKIIDQMSDQAAREASGGGQDASQLAMLQQNMQYLPQSTQNVLQSFTQQYGNGWNQQAPPQRQSQQQMLQLYSQYNAATLQQLDANTLKQMPCFECGLPLSDVSHWVHGKPSQVQPYNEGVSGQNMKVLGSQLCLERNNKQKMCQICQKPIAWGQGYQSKTKFVNGMKTYEYTCNTCYLASLGNCRVCGNGFRDVNQVLGGTQTGYSLHRRCLVCQFCGQNLNPSMQIFWENDKPSHKRQNNICMAQS